MLADSRPFLRSPALLDAHRAVLLRPKPRRAHGLRASEINAVLAQIVANALWREPPAGGLPLQIP